MVEMKKGNRLIQKYLVVWAHYPLDEVTWGLETNFPDRVALKDDIKSRRIPEVK